jgi:hypothetical protein
VVAMIAMVPQADTWLERLVLDSMMERESSKGGDDGLADAMDANLNMREHTEMLMQIMSKTMPVV